jgi:predicted Zn-dependent protease
MGVGLTSESRLFSIYHTQWELDDVIAMQWIKYSVQWKITWTQEIERRYTASVSHLFSRNLGHSASLKKQMSLHISEWSWQTSGILRRVVSKKFTDVSEMFCSDNETIKHLWNVWALLRDYKVPQYTYHKAVTVILTTVRTWNQYFRIIFVSGNRRSLNNISPNVVVELLTLLLRIREFPSSNLGPETGYPDWGVSCFLRHYRQILL